MPIKEAESYQITTKSSEFWSIWFKKVVRQHKNTTHCFFNFFFKITFGLGWTQPTSYLNNLGQRVLKYWQTGKLLSNP